MAQFNQNEIKVIGLMFSQHRERFTVREISQKTKIPSSTVQRVLKKFRKKNLLEKDNKVIINSYTKFLKTYLFIDILFTSGLIDYLINELKPSVIILFGSFRKGEYDRDSDIDFFVATNEKKELNLSKFEKLLNHKIDLFTEKQVYNLQPRLMNNVVNGIKLFGYFELK